MKFCKDCAHYTLPFDGAGLHLGLCSRKEASKDPVTGLFEGSVPHPFCGAERISLTGNCGRDAIHFKAKDVPHV